MYLLTIGDPVICCPSLNYGLFIIVSQNAVFAYFSEGNSSGQHGIASTALSTNIWHHVAVVRDGADFKLYVDGIEVDSLAIGGGASMQFVDGFFDEHR